MRSRLPRVSHFGSSTIGCSVWASSAVEITGSAAIAALGGTSVGSRSSSARISQRTCSGWNQVTRCLVSSPANTTAWTASAVAAIPSTMRWRCMREKNVAATTGNKSAGRMTIRCTCQAPSNVTAANAETRCSSPAPRIRPLTLAPIAGITSHRLAPSITCSVERSAVSNGPCHMSRASTMRSVR